MRNICPECLSCPDNKHSIRQCIAECSYPIEVLMKKEAKRNRECKKGMRNRETE